MLYQNFKLLIQILVDTEFVHKISWQSLVTIVTFASLCHTMISYILLVICNGVCGFKLASNTQNLNEWIL